MNPSNPIAQDMRTLDSLLRESVAPHLRVDGGQCDEAGSPANFGKSQTCGGVSLIGDDIRIREIMQARKNHAHLPAEFLLEDATRLSHHKALRDDFKLVLLRHQNFWHGPELWKKIFEQGLAKVDEHGLIVISSYFAKKHRLALDALQTLGAEVVLSRRNELSRKLTLPGKSVDKHIAVLRRRK